MKVSENTSVQLDLKTVIAIIMVTASFVGMYYTLQADIEEAKKLSNSNQQLLEQFKVANAKYEQLVELVKEQEGVEQSATEVVE